MTEAEQRLWTELRRRALGCRVRRQHVVLGWITDFFVPAARLVIEVDGDIHDHHEDDDRRRTEALEAAGLRVIRFRNLRVEEQIDAVVADIAAAIEAATAAPPAAPPVAPLPRRG
jgi:very-short-patch-repair endonuclease